MAAPIRLRPGQRGFATAPTGPEEALLVQNMVLSRDGFWGSRFGFVTQHTAAATIYHLSNHPNGHLMMVHSSNLYKVNPASSWTPSLLESTGWPTAYGLRPGRNKRQWVACKSNPTGSAAAARRVDSSGTVTNVNLNSNGTMLESHNRLILKGNYNDGVLEWSDDDGVDGTWPAGNNGRAVASIGELMAISNISDSQSLLHGTLGLGLIAGTNSTALRQQDLGAFPCAFGGTTPARCGDAVFWLGPQGQLFRFKGGGVELGAPLRETLRGLTFATNSFGFWDQALNYYCLSNQDAGKTYVYDIERDAWLGYWDKALVGYGRSNVNSSNQYGLYAYGAKLVEYGRGAASYQDDGSSFTCALETYPDEAEGLQAEKSLQKLYLDAVGSWTVTLYGRSDQSGSWTSLWTSGSVTGPTLLFPTRNLYRQRKIRIEATGGSTLKFREMLLWERSARHPRAA